MKKAAFLVTFFGLLLPYRLRVFYGFLLNFILAPLNLLVQFFGFLNQGILLILFSLIYFFIIPISILLKPKKAVVDITLNQEISKQDLFRIF